MSCWCFVGTLNTRTWLAKHLGRRGSGAWLSWMFIVDVDVDVDHQGVEADTNDNSDANKNPR